MSDTSENYLRVILIAIGFFIAGTADHPETINMVLMQLFGASLIFLGIKGMNNER